MFSVSINFSALSAQIQKIQAETEIRARRVIDDAADYAEAQFLKRVGEQVALPSGRVRNLVALEKKPNSATLTASDEPIRLEEYPHRQTKDGVEVQINPGSVSTLTGAFVSRNGHIVRREYGGGIPAQQYGPGVDQIANTEFPVIAAEVERIMKQEFSR